MTDTTLDIDYIRRVGEEIQARLFPRPRADGRQPDPRPVALRYQPGDGTDCVVRFVSERTMQWVDGTSIDVRASVVSVSIDWMTVVADLAFGKQPEIHETDVEALEAAFGIMALLRAVAGVL